MLNSEAIKRLSQVNIGKDMEKIKERIKALWLPLDSGKRQEILDLSGLTKFTVQRTYREGTISAKLMAAISQVLKINPAYLTGESDDETGYSGSLLNKFLAKKDTKNKRAAAKSKRKAKVVSKEAAASSDTDEAGLVKVSKRSASRKSKNPAKPKRKYTRKAAAESISHGASDEASLGDVLALAKAISQTKGAKKDKIDSMSNEETVVLLNSMFLRANFNSDSDKLLRLVKYALTN